MTLDAPARRRRRVIWTIVFVLLALLVFIAAWVGIRGFLAYQQLVHAKDLVTQIQSEAIADKDFDRARGDVAELQKSADDARSLTSDIVWRIAEVTPWAGKNLTVVRQVASVIADTADHAVEPLLDVAGTFDPATFKPTGGKLDLAPVVAAQPKVAAASKALRSSASVAASIDTSGTVGALGDAARQLKTLLGDTADQVATLDKTVDLLPGMLGQDGPRDYLFVFLNNAELRSKGGIVGATALVGVDDGRMTLKRQAADSEFPMSAKVLGDLETATLGLYTPVVGQYIQNAAGLADWPASVRIIRDMWKQRFGDEVQGVVSIDPVALSYILKATGPITVSGVTIDSSNAVEYLLHTVYEKIPSPAQQDAFFGATAAAVFQKVASGSFDASAMIDALVQSGDERRINLWSADAGEQKQLAASTLGGGLPVSTSSHQTFGVYLNDATGAKMDYYLKTSVGAAQLVCGADGTPTYRVQIEMTNTAPADAATLPRYITGGGDYGVEPGKVQTDVYVYAPPGVSVRGGWITGSDIDGHKLLMQSATESGRSVGKYRVTLAPGESKTATMDFVGKSPFSGSVGVEVTPLVSAPGKAAVETTCGTPSAAPTH